MPPMSPTSVALDKSRSNQESNALAGSQSLELDRINSTNRVIIFS